MSKKKFYRGVNKLLPKAKFKDCDDYATLLAGWEDTRPIPTEAEIDVAYDDYEMEEAITSICMKAHMKITGFFRDDCDAQMELWELLILTLCHLRDKGYYPLKRSPAEAILDEGSVDVPTTGFPRLMTDMHAIVDHKNKLLNKLDAINLPSLDVDAGTLDTVNGGGHCDP